MRSAQRPSLPRAVERLPGGGAPRLLAAAADRWLVVADVPRDAFGERTLDTHLKDLDWVSRCGAAHSAVVDHYLPLATATVVPMALFTIFDSDARALTEIRRDPARLDATFDRIAGRVEFVVRVLRGEPAPRAIDGAAAAPDGRHAKSTLFDAKLLGDRTPSSARATTGRDFLQAKAEQRLAAKRAAQEIDAAVHTLTQGLTAVAEDTSTRAEAPGLGAPALLDSVFLIAKSAQARFKQEARRLARPLTERGYRVTVTGPWPCYYFIHGTRSS